MLDFIVRGKIWDVWEGAQASFESLDLMTEGIKKEQLLRSIGETGMGDLGVVGILMLENSEWQKECFEAEFAKELDLNELYPKLCFWTIASLEFEIVGETQKLETDTGLTKTGKIWDFEWSGTKLDFRLQFVL